MSMDGKNDQTDDELDVVTDVDDDDDDAELEIIDDTPEKDRGRPRRADGVEPELPDEDELKQYSEGVQKRIKQMSYEYHEERRNKEAFARQLEESANMTRLLLQRNAELQKQMDERAKQTTELENTSAEEQLKAAQAAFQSAFDDGDSAKMTEASSAIARATAAIERIKTMRSMPVPQQPQQYPQFQQRQFQPQVDPAAAAWAQRNRWYNNDPKMTATAKGIHNDMVARGEPIGDANYYKKLDSEMRSMFPSYFSEAGDEQPATRKTPGNVVAPASRGGGNQPRTKITLTASEVALAKRMGLSPKEYAREKQALKGA